MTRVSALDSQPSDDHVPPPFGQQLEEAQVALSYSEKQAIVELERQFSTPRHRLLISLHRWGDLLLGLVAMTAVLLGLIVLLASVH